MELIQNELNALEAKSRIQQLRQAAIAYEANFLNEMISQSGLGKAGENLGSGVGGDAFASLLTEQYSLEIAKKGGVGLADVIFEALMKASKK